LSPPLFPYTTLFRSSLISSAIFHLALIVLVFVGLPQLFTPKPLEDTPIAVQLVTLASETRATKLTKTPPKPDAKPEPQIAQAVRSEEHTSELQSPCN